MINRELHKTKCTCDNTAGAVSRTASVSHVGISLADLLFSILFHAHHSLLLAFTWQN